jgi:transposase-like protein
LAIPKIRRGSYFPSFLEPRKRSEQALVAVIQEAYVAGVSTRKVDQVVESLGLRVSRSEVSRICQGLDEQVEAFRERPLEGGYPYLFLDAKVEKVRDGGRVVRKCLVIAHGVHESGRREVIGLDVGESETEAFWREFLHGLVRRGLLGVELVVSDAHAGLKAAIAQVLGCSWQRCSVHFLRESLGHARKEQQGMLGALLRPIFNAADGDSARALLGDALERLRAPLPKVATLLEQAEEDLEKGALAGAVRADEADDPRLDLDRQAVEGGHPARVALRQGGRRDEAHRAKGTVWLDLLGRGRSAPVAQRRW